MASGMVGPESVTPDVLTPGVAVPTPRADLGVGAFVVFLGVVTLLSAFVIPASPLAVQVGPKAVPFIIAAFLVAVGAGLCAVALRGGWSGDLEEMRDVAPLNARALALLFAGLLVQLALIEFLGFVVAATAQFVLVAAAFGSRRPLRDFLIGAVVTVAAYLGFSEVLGVNIGQGALFEHLAERGFSLDPRALLGFGSSGTTN